MKKSTFEMTVESMFHITGQGTVLAGRIQSGQIVVGNSVDVLSPSHTARSVVVGLEKERKILGSAKAGEDIAVLLKDFSPERFSDGLEWVEPGICQVVNLHLRGIEKPWWCKNHKMRTMRSTESPT